MTLLEKYNSFNVTPSNFVLGLESKEYEACQFKIENQYFLGRTAKLTPNKNGLFVTLWKRNKASITTPFHEIDSIDFSIILVTEKENKGYFKFPKEILIKKGIFSTETKEGKRGFRVYPPWVKTTSKQADKTQKWQIEHFTNIAN